MSKISLNVNGHTHAVDADPETPLLYILRNDLKLNGAKFGCGIGQCGACTIHLNGIAVRGCQTPVSSAVGFDITTIESLDKEGKHPLQQAWCELDVAQCGYCQSGQIMTASALLKRNPKPTDQDIDDAMAGNLCRCATYTRIRAGIHKAAELTAGKEAGV